MSVLLGRGEVRNWRALHVLAVPISCDRVRTSTKKVRAKMGGVLQSGGAYTLVTTLVKSTAASWPNSGHSADM